MVWSVPVASNSLVWISIVVGWSYVLLQVQVTTSVIYFKYNTYIQGLILVKQTSTFTWQVSPAVKLVGLERLLHSDHMHGHDHIMNFLYYHELITTFTDNVRDHYLGNEYWPRPSWSLSWSWILGQTFVIIILVMSFMEKRRDHYLGNEYSQIHYLQSLSYYIEHMDSRSPKTVNTQ